MAKETREIQVVGRASLASVMIQGSGLVCDWRRRTVGEGEEALMSITLNALQDGSISKTASYHYVGAERDAREPADRLAQEQ